MFFLVFIFVQSLLIWWHIRIETTKTSITTVRLFDPRWTHAHATSWTRRIASSSLVRSAPRWDSDPEPDECPLDQWSRHPTVCGRKHISLLEDTFHLTHLKPVHVYCHRFHFEVFFHWFRSFFLPSFKYIKSIIMTDVEKLNITFEKLEPEKSHWSMNHCVIDSHTLSVRVFNWIFITDQWSEHLFSYFPFTKHIWILISCWYYPYNWCIKILNL